MAFNFNWSPLTADASFYTRAQELLTAALNKSPKPPIIVDDILVNELNLGSVPPDLEILEIGDLAEDRFRGIFKMCYTGDAFLTLKTRVQVYIEKTARHWTLELRSAIGKPSQHLFINKTFIRLSTTPRRIFGFNNSHSNHPVRDQIVSVHNTRLLETKRSYPSVPKRPFRIP